MAETNGYDVNPAKVLTILGCGALGSAILHALLARSAPEKSRDGLPKQLVNGHSSPSLKAEKKVESPTRFIACVRTEASATRLKRELADRFGYPVPVKVLYGDNVSATQFASTVILGCQPQDLHNCLREDGLTEALQGKLVISILAGITIPQLESCIDGPHLAAYQTRTTIIRAMPNTSALHNASTTLLAVDAGHPPAPDALALTRTLLSSIGAVHPIPPEQMDACTALCGSTPAFFTPILGGLLDGAVALGLKRSQARMLMVETMRGVAENLEKGKGIDELAEEVCTPGGSSIQGLLALERGGIRGVLADALCAAAGANGALGRNG